jgi:hypothetical protein
VRARRAPICPPAPGSGSEQGPGHHERERQGAPAPSWRSERMHGPGQTTAPRPLEPSEHRKRWLLLAEGTQVPPPCHGRRAGRPCRAATRPSLRQRRSSRRLPLTERAPNAPTRPSTSLLRRMTMERRSRGRR